MGKKVFEEFQSTVFSRISHKSCMKDVLGELKDRVETEILRKSMKTVFSELKNEIASTEANKNSIKKIFEDLESLKELRLASSNVHKSSMKLVFDEMKTKIESDNIKDSMKQV